MPNSVVYLTDKDRERLGVPGPLEVDLAELMQDEAEILDEHGIDPDGWEEFLRSDALRRWRAIVWLALRRNGIQVPYGELNFDRRGMRFESAPEPGKAPAARSAKSGATTRRRSSSTSRA